MKQATKIKTATVYPFLAPLTQPFRTAPGEHKILENILLVIGLEDGTLGYGEAGVATHITGETIPETTQNLKQAARELIGADARDYEALSQSFLPRLSKNKSALAAIEMSLLDASTKVKKIPLWRLYGERPERLRTDMTVVIGDIEEASTLTQKILARGIRSFKVKVGREINLDFERVRAVHTLVGPFPIYLDANQGYTADESIALLERLARVGIKPELIEQPVPKDDWAGLKKVTDAQLAHTIADESVYTLEDAKRLITEKAATGINVKLMKSGLLESEKIARLARKSGLKLMIGTMMETPLAVTAAAHLAAGIGGFDYVDLDAPFFVDTSVADRSWVSSDGVYNLSGVEKGIGVTPLIPEVAGPAPQEYRGPAHPQ